MFNESKFKSFCISLGGRIEEIDEAPGVKMIDCIIHGDVPLTVRFKIYRDSKKQVIELSSEDEELTIVDEEGYMQLSASRAEDVSVLQDIGARVVELYRYPVRRIRIRRTVSDIDIYID